MVFKPGNHVLATEKMDEDQTKITDIKRAICENLIGSQMALI